MITDSDGEIVEQNDYTLEYNPQRINRKGKNVAHEALKDSVARHLVSDVPISACLSGGYDSTALSALAIENSPKSIQKSFTIGFNEDGEQTKGSRIKNCNPPVSYSSITFEASKSSKLLRNFSMQWTNQPTMV